MHVDVSEILAFARDIERNADAVPGQVKLVIAKGGHDSLATMQSITPVDTGNLKNSESVDFTDNAMGFEVGPTAEYGVYVEEGTSKMSAEPYVAPAVDRVFPSIEAALGDIVDGAFRG